MLKNLNIFAKLRKRREKKKNKKREEKAHNDRGRDALPSASAASAASATGGTAGGGPRSIQQPAAHDVTTGGMLPPQIEGPAVKSPRTLRYGEAATISVKVSGIPAPDVKWYLGSKEIRNTRDFRTKDDGTRYTLFVGKANDDINNKGITVVAKNRVAEKRILLDLKVYKVLASRRFVDKLNYETDNVEDSVKLPPSPRRKLRLAVGESVTSLGTSSPSSLDRIPVKQVRASTISSESLLDDVFSDNKKSPLRHGSLPRDARLSPEGARSPLASDFKKSSTLPRTSEKRGSEVSQPSSTSYDNPPYPYRGSAISVGSESPQNTSSFYNNSVGSVSPGPSGNIYQTQSTPSYSSVPDQQRHSPEKAYGNMTPDARIEPLTNGYLYNDPRKRSSTHPEQEDAIFTSDEMAPSPILTFSPEVLDTTNSPVYREANFHSTPADQFSPKHPHGPNYNDVFNKPSRYGENDNPLQTMFPLPTDKDPERNRDSGYYDSFRSSTSPYYDNSSPYTPAMESVFPENKPRFFHETFMPAPVLVYHATPVYNLDSSAPNARKLESGPSYIKKDALLGWHTPPSYNQSLEHGSLSSQAPESLESTSDLNGDSGYFNDSKDAFGYPDLSTVSSFQDSSYEENDREGEPDIGPNQITQNTATAYRRPTYIEPVIEEDLEQTSPTAQYPGRYSPVGTSSPAHVRKQSDIVPEGKRKDDVHTRLSPLDDLLLDSGIPHEYCDFKDRISPAGVEDLTCYTFPDLPAQDKHAQEPESRPRYRSSVAEDHYCEIRSPSPVSFHEIDDSTFMEFSFMSPPSPTPPEVLASMASRKPETETPVAVGEKSKPLTQDRKILPEEDHEGYKRRCIYEKRSEEVVEYIRENEPPVRRRKRIASETVQRVDEITFKTPEENPIQENKTGTTPTASKGPGPAVKTVAAGLILALLVALLAMQTVYFWMSEDEDRN